MTVVAPAYVSASWVVATTGQDRGEMVSRNDRAMTTIDEATADVTDRTASVQCNCPARGRSVAIRMALRRRHF